MRVVEDAERDTNVDGGPLTGLRTDGRLALYQTRAFLDAGKTETAVLAGSKGIEPFAIVSNRQGEMTIAACERYRGMPGAGVPRGISKRLLRNPKQRQCRWPARGFDLIVCEERHMDVMLSLHLGAM